MVTRSNEKWFSMPAGNYCGVLIKDKTAKKLQKLLYRHTQEVKDLLTQNKEDLLSYHWTIAYPDGKQTTVHYSCNDYHWDDVEHRIKLFDGTDRLRYEKDVFISDKIGVEASEEVKAFYEEWYSEGVGVIT